MLVIVRKGEGVGDTALLHTQVEGCCSFPLLPCCSLSFCPALLAEGVRARVYYTAHIGTAACPFLPLPCCQRPKTILAFPAASGLQKAGLVGQ